MPRTRNIPARPLQDITHHFLPSSLPPSSPPPDSSHPDQSSDDPFGFFAVERHLKAQRSTLPPPPPLPIIPPTPHKPRRRPTFSPPPSTSRLYSPATASVPGTPSPSKTSKGKQSEKRSNEHLEPSSSQMRLKKPRLSDSPPRRSTRRTTAIKAPVKQPAAPTKKKPVARKTPAPSKANIKPKSKPKDMDPDEQERWERERQARVDYFKKLDGYEVQKENVYII